MPELTANAVADHGPADSARDHEAGTRGEEIIGAGRIGRADREVHDQEGGPAAPGAAATSPQRCREVGAAPQPGAGREHAGQAESRERPLARRPARMARPARVRIRRRNPWVFARRRLFGWNVRLLTRGLPYDGLERRQRCLSQGVEPMRPAPVGRPRRNEKQWKHGHATAAVGTARPAHGTCVRPAWSNRTGLGATASDSGRQQADRDRPADCEPPTVTGSVGRVCARHAAVCPHRGKKTDGLWTTACWGPLVWVASPSAGRLPSPPARNGAPARWTDPVRPCSTQHDSEQLSPTRCDARDARWGPLCTQAVDDGVDERHHRTNRAIAPAHGWTSREHCDRRDHRNGPGAHGYPL